jgi:hypothetical protein
VIVLVQTNARAAAAAAAVAGFEKCDMIEGPTVITDPLDDSERGKNIPKTG